MPFIELKLNYCRYRFFFFHAEAKVGKITVVVNPLWSRPIIMLSISEFCLGLETVKQNRVEPTFIKTGLSNASL